MVTAMPERLRGLGERIRRARTASGLTETALAARLDVDQSTVSKWERGEIQPLGLRRRELARALGVHYHALFIPEEVEEQLTPDERRLLLTARRYRGGDALYVRCDRSDRAASRLRLFWLLEDAGNDPRRLADGRRLYFVTGPGEDVLLILQADEERLR